MCCRYRSVLAEVPTERRGVDGALSHNPQIVPTPQVHHCGGGETMAVGVSVIAVAIPPWK